MYVYFAINSVNLKMYVGKSIDPKSRWYSHVRAAIQEDDDYAFHRAIRKYGMDNIHFDILEACSSEEESLVRETYWIEKYDTLVDGGWGYNMTLGGDGCIQTPEGLIARGKAISAALSTPEARQRRSEQSKLRWQDPDFRSRHIQVLNSPEQLERNRQQALENWEDPEYRAKCTAVMNTPERKEKSRQSLNETRSQPGFLEKQRELWKTPEYIEAQLAGVRAPEHRALVSATVKERWNQPGYRKRQSEIVTARYATPERLAIIDRAIELRLQGWTLERIGKEIGRSEAVVSKILIKANVKKPKP